MTALLAFFFNHRKHITRALQNTISHHITSKPPNTKSNTLKQNWSHQEHYRGLTWQRMNKDSWKAYSDTTGTSYKIDPDALNPHLCLLKAGFADKPGRPFKELGVHKDPLVAKAVAEWDDFQYWKSVSERNGRSPVFVGSPDGVEAFFRELSGSDVQDTLALLDNQQTPVPFDKTASFFQSVSKGLKQEKTGDYTLTLNVEAAHVPIWLFGTKPGTILNVGVQQVGVEEDEHERAKGALRRFFALIQDQTFHEWMLHRYDRWGLMSKASTQNHDAVEAACEETLKRLLGTPQRRELLHHFEAVEKLERLDREYYTDLSMGWSAGAPKAANER